MLSFSQRKGLKPVRDQIQVDRMDNQLRNCLWNIVTSFYWQRVPEDFTNIHNKIRSESPTHKFLLRLWHNFFKSPVDTIDERWSRNLATIRKYFFESNWYEVYDFIEFIANNSLRPSINESFMQACNSVLETELSAYRFVAGTISELTSEVEISAIEDALADAKGTEPFAKHLRAALALFSDREAPDYRNSIKESISAVEALSQLLVGDSRATLGKALKELDKKNLMHPSLINAFINFYGYTSDAEGIRHAMSEEPTLVSEDAKFMLVACSAFINYLRAKALRAGISL